MFKLLAFAFFIIAPKAFAVDMKISSLPTLPQSSWASGDMIPIVDLSVTTTKKTTIADFDERFVQNASFPSGILAESNGGTGASQAFKALNVDTSTVGNVSGVDSNLANYSMPGNTLTTDGNAVAFNAAGRFEADSNNKRMLVKFGATDVLDTGTMNFGIGGTWRVDGECIRLAASSQKCSASLITSISSYPAFASYAAISEDLTGTVNLKITSASSAGSSVNKNEIFKAHFRP